MALLTLIATTTVAQEGRVHYWNHGIMPPGAIGGRQLMRGGPLRGFFQPVEIKAPKGVLISLASEGQFERPRPAPTRAGMLIGQVYRFKVSNIRLRPGVEVFPTIEVIDRLYCPPDQKQRFAIPVELTEVDLVHALQGKLVTRIIYLEDPQKAFPVLENPDEQEWFDVGPNRDPLAVADTLGRPVAILRMGARMPDSSGPDLQFLYGCPPFVQYPPRRKLPKPAPKPAPAAAAPAEPAPAPAGPAAVPAEPVPAPPEPPVPAPPVPGGP